MPLTIASAIQVPLVHHAWIAGISLAAIVMTGAGSLVAFSATDGSAVQGDRLTIACSDALQAGCRPGMRAFRTIELRGPQTSVLIRVPQSDATAGAALRP